MDRKFKISANILICVIILIGFIALALTSYNTYSHIINDDIMNISKLTSTNIYSDIRNELTKPIFVSLTMANDSFLKKWLRNEKTDNTAEHQEELRQYLLGLKMKYGYDSVFLVSGDTHKYYHYNGLNKVVRESDAHDVWYYTFVNSGQTYDLDVDTDEANHNQLSVFVNCRMTDEDGNLMGVTGVGLVLNHVQGLLKSFEDEYGLKALLFSEDGTVQVDTQTDEIEQENVFDAGILRDNQAKILSSSGQLEVFPFQDESLGGFYITRYVEDLNWYLLIKKDTSVLARSMYAQTVRDIVIYVLVAVCVLLIANRIIRKNDHLMMNMTRTDLLTNLPNRRGFNESLEKAIAEAPDRGDFCVFVFDIDSFKTVNDTHGHLVGDKVLRVIGQLAADAFTDAGAVCRWGGDEFAGYWFGSKEEMTEVADLFFASIRREPAFTVYPITVSMGVTLAQKVDSAHTLIYRADQALYQAKGSGKNRYCFIESPDHIECSN
jgi:diguanylate cyclase (GGDEF)-like protein